MIVHRKSSLGEIVETRVHLCRRLATHNIVCTWTVTFSCVMDGLVGIHSSTIKTATWVHSVLVLRNAWCCAQCSHICIHEYSTDVYIMGLAGRNQRCISCAILTGSKTPLTLQHCLRHLSKNRVKFRRPSLQQKVSHLNTNSSLVDLIIGRMETLYHKSRC